MPIHSTLLSLLHQNKIITSSEQQLIAEQAEEQELSIPLAIIESGILDAQGLNQHLSRLFELPICQLSDYSYHTLCQSLGLRELITRFSALPIALNGDKLQVAIADPSDPQVENDFQFATGKLVELVLTDCKTLHTAIRRLYGDNLSQQSKEISQDKLAELVQVSDDELSQKEDLSQDDSPVSRFINQVLIDAVHKGASDIHFEPYETSYRIRQRCDGILIETHQPTPRLARRLAARIKILAKLDIAERRLPQDGRMKLHLNSHITIDMRVSSLPTLWGEKVVLRILDSSRINLDIDQLGYTEEQKKQYLQALAKPQGMILMTGPTGSGKTVSLYTGLKILNTEQRNISTAEDPIEINLSGVNQVQLNTKIGFGFAQALRAFLRQDPDVVMVGEIRDKETAEIAMKAAQTGHLVLSTLHTNSAVETVIRLKNMGIESFNLTSSISLIIAQRLVRKLCEQCKQIEQNSTALYKQFQLDHSKSLYQANRNGCEECNSGYSGRIGIYEVMPFTDELIQLIECGASTVEINALAKKQGMLSLQKMGLEKLTQGMTSFAELQRVLAI